MFGIEKIYIILAGLVLIFPLSLVAAPASGDQKSDPILVLTKKTDSIRINDYLTELAVRKGALTPEQATSPEYHDRYRADYSRNIMDDDPKMEYWLRLRIRNESDISDWHLSMEWTYIMTREIYLVRKGGLVRLKEDQSSNIPSASLKLEPGNQATLYIRANMGFHRMLTVRMMEPARFRNRNTFESLFLGGFFATVLTMLLYNGILALRLRDGTYGIYVAYTLAIAIYSLGVTGASGFLGLTDIYLNKLCGVMTPIWIGLLIFFAARYMGMADRYPRLNRFYVAAAIFMVMNAGSFFFLAWLSFVVYINFLSMAAVVFLVLATMVIALRLRTARIFLLTFLPVMIGGSLLALAELSFFKATRLVSFAPQIGTAFELVFLSIALADRINILRQEKEGAQQDSIRHQSESIASLVQADRIKDDFLAAASHELRTPLQGIIGLSSQLLEKGEGFSPRSRESLELIAAGGRKLRTLVLDLLDFSRLKNHDLRVDPRPVSLRPLVDASLRAIAPLLGDRSIELKNEVPPDLPAILADENRLLQIFSNLLDNALKYTREGSISVSATTQNGSIEITVRDTGSGIEPQYQEHIFKPYEQGQDAVGGTGIGLAVVRHLSELQCGTIRVESTPGEGSSFILEFPRAKKHAPAGKVASSQPAPATYIGTTAPEFQDPPSPRALLLLVDDDPTILRVMGDMLTDESYAVRTAPDGEAALLKLENESFDAVLLDLMLPGRSGLEICRKIRRTRTAAELPVIAITARERREDLLETISAGATDYMTKPFEKQDLILRVRHAIRLRRLYQERRRSGKKLEKAVEEEKERIYRDLHDHLGAQLTDLTIQARNLSEEPQIDQEILRELQQGLRSASSALRDRLHHIDDLRRLAREFLPGLNSVLLRRYARAERPLIFHYEPALNRRLSGFFKTEAGRNLYSLCYEIATNDLKYGRNESHWDFTINSDSLEISMEAETEYTGTRKAGHGSRTMAARAAKLDAKLDMRIEQGVFRLELRMLPVS